MIPDTFRRLLIIILSNSRNYGDYYNFLIKDYEEYVIIDYEVYNRERAMLYNIRNLYKLSTSSDYILDFEKILLNKNFDYFIEFLYNLYTSLKYYMSLNNYDPDPFHFRSGYVYSTVVYLEKILYRYINSYIKIFNIDKIKNEKLLKIIFLFLNENS